jgi:hypothetical protein
MGGGSATAKTASYVLVAADAGTTIIMNAAGATTITVNTALFAAGDTVLIQNIGAGTCTVTAGTATVSTAGSLALTQYEAGILYFTATGTALFHDYVQAGGGGKVLQMVSATTSTSTTVASTTLTDTTLTATITPTLATSKVLILITQHFRKSRTSGIQGAGISIFRGATNIWNGTDQLSWHNFAGVTDIQFDDIFSVDYVDSPATTSATTYKTQGEVWSTANSGNVVFQDGSRVSTITLLEIGA